MLEIITNILLSPESIAIASFKEVADELLVCRLHIFLTLTMKTHGSIFGTFCLRDYQSFNCQIFNGEHVRECYSQTTAA